MHGLPREKAEQISEFADFMIKSYEDQELTHDIEYIASEDSSFDFLNEEEDLYTVDDLIEIYHGKR